VEVDGAATCDACGLVLEQNCALNYHETISMMASQTPAMNQNAWDQPTASMDLRRENATGKAVQNRKQLLEYLVDNLKIVGSFQFELRSVMVQEMLVIHDQIDHKYLKRSFTRIKGAIGCLYIYCRRHSVGIAVAEIAAAAFESPWNSKLKVTRKPRALNFEEEESNDDDGETEMDPAAAVISAIWDSLQAYKLSVPDASLPRFSPGDFFNRWMGKLNFRVADMIISQPILKCLSEFIQSKAGLSDRVETIACTSIAYFVFCISRNEVHCVSVEDPDDLERLRLPDGLKEFINCKTPLFEVVRTVISCLLGGGEMKHFRQTLSQVNARLIVLGSAVLPVQLSEANIERFLPVLVYSLKTFLELYEDVRGESLPAEENASFVRSQKRKAKVVSALQLAASGIDLLHPEKREIVDDLASEFLKDIDISSLDKEEILGYKIRLLGDESISEIMDRRVKRARFEDEDPI
jgi:hypothetical protein